MPTKITFGKAPEPQAKKPTWENVECGDIIKFCGDPDLYIYSSGVYCNRLQGLTGAAAGDVWSSTGKVPVSWNIERILKSVTITEN